MLNAYKHFREVDGWTQFNLVWTPLWFILEAILAVTTHSVFALVFMFVFAALFVLTIWQVNESLKIEAQIAEEEAKYRKEVDRLFGRKDDAA